MITKTIIIDEKEIFEKIFSKLDKKYNLVYISYDDEIPAELMQKCIDEKSIYPMTEQDPYDDYYGYYAKEILNELLKKELAQDEIDLFRDTEEYLELINEIESRDESTPVRDLIKTNYVSAYLRFHSNYDCWLPIWEQGGIQCWGTALAGILAALSLNPKKVKEAAMRRGIETFGPFRNLPSREGKEVVDYDDFINVLCEMPNYGNWSFFGRLQGSELLDAEFDYENMTIPKGTTCGMFNWWNGSGSLDFCETLRDVNVKDIIKRLAMYKDCLKLVVDDKIKSNTGYCPTEVYGSPVSSHQILKA